MRFRDSIELDAKELGRRLRTARERQGLSQEEFGSLVSRDQGAISEYESGKRGISATDLPRFAEHLDVSLLYFYEDSLNTNDLDQALLNEFQRLPSPNTKKAAIQIMRIFTESHLI